MTANLLGIFATCIPSAQDHSIRRLRSLHLTDAQAERFVSIVVVAVNERTGEAMGDIDAGIRERRIQIKVSRAVELVSAAICEAEITFTARTLIRGAGEGFEGNAPIQDGRVAGGMVEAWLLSVLG